MRSLDTLRIASASRWWHGEKCMRNARADTRELTMQKVSSFCRCSGEVPGSDASSKHSLMRDRSACACVASCGAAGNSGGPSAPCSQSVGGVLGCRHRLRREPLYTAGKAAWPSLSGSMKHKAMPGHLEEEGVLLDAGRVEGVVGRAARHHQNIVWQIKMVLLQAHVPYQVGLSASPEICRKFCAVALRRCPNTGCCALRPQQ